MLPLPVLAWLANIVFIGIPVMVAFVTVAILLDPRGTPAEGLLESHKAIVIGAVALSGVAMVEAFCLSRTRKLDNKIFEIFLILIFFLFIAMIAGVLTFQIALSRYTKNEPHLDAELIWQVILGLVLLVCTCTVAMRFKYIDYQLTNSQESGGKPAAPSPAPTDATASDQPEGQP